MKAYNKQYHNIEKGLLETMYFDESELEEATIIDNISKNLKRGRFLLLIVGDGIRESVEEMVYYLSQTPQLHFTMALVELQVYQNQGALKDSFLVIPQIITRTKEITRAVVRVEGLLSDQVKVEMPTEAEQNIKRRTSTKGSLSEQDFLDAITENVSESVIPFLKTLMEDVESRGYIVDYGKSSMIIKFTHPILSGSKLSLFIIYKSGGIQLGWTAGVLSKLGLSSEIAEQFCENTANLFESISQEPKYKIMWNREGLSITELQKNYNEFMRLVDEYTESIIKQLEELS